MWFLVFSTRFECGFPDTAVVVGLNVDHDELCSEVSEELGKIQMKKNHERKLTLETSGEDVLLHSKRVEKMCYYTRNEVRRFETTPQTS